MDKIPQHIRNVLETLARAGHDAYLVGGCVRDLLRGAEPHDWDVATSAEPRETSALFTKTAPTGEKYGTVTVLTDGGGAEVTTFRVDGKYPDGVRKPESVGFTRDIRADLSRRDFTVNAVAMGADGALTDPFGGQRDIEAGVIRCVGDAEDRFREDPLRMLRAMRFYAQLGYRIERETYGAILKSAQLSSSLSRERVRDEVVKIIMTNPAVLAECVSLGLLAPTAAACKLPTGAADPIGDLPPELELRLAACAAILIPGAISSPRAFLRELRFPNQLAAAAAGGAEAALEHDFPASRPDYKRLCARIGDSAARAACAAKDAIHRKNEHLAAIDEVIASGECRNLGGLAVNGDDLAAAGIPKSRETGDTLRRLLEHVIENPRDNTRDTLIMLIKNRLISGQ